jgi:dihydrofolate synthase / folylpolyglutamate synthase
VQPPPTDSLPAVLDRFYRRTALGIRPGLEIITALLDRLDRPQDTFPYVHVAGTNGKGSVCALIAAVLQAAGYRTGLYTSPHLIRFNERIRIDGEAVSDQELAHLAARVEQESDHIARAHDARQATFFECATAMAFAHFRDRAVDWAVIETGLGGRWDATNTGTPALTVITRIDLDHMEYLGPDRRSIAREKAGILRPGVPVVCGALDEESLEEITRAAAVLGAPLVMADQTVRVERMAQDVHGQKVRIETDERTLRPLKLPLTGRHQLGNCALAVAVLETLGALGRMELSDAALTRGLAAARWPARCQVLETEPLLLLDAAHNPDGAAALARTLKELAGDRPLGMVVGFLADKDAAGCVAHWARWTERFWAVPIEHERALSAEALQAVVARTGRPVTVAPPDAALAQARDWARDNGGVVCIAGSLYLAGTVLQLLEPAVAAHAGRKGKGSDA